MAYIGKTPTPVPLTSSDITNGIVTGEKLNADVISSQTELATAPASTDEFLISDAGTLKRLDASLVGSADVVKLNETTHSSDVATISIDGHHTSDYDIYDYIIDDFSVDADSNAIRVRVNMGGSAQTGAAYRNAGWDAYRSSSGHTLGANGDWNQSYFRPNANWGSPRSTSYDRGYLHIRLVNPLSTTIYKYGYYWNTYSNHDDSQQVAQSGGWRYQTSQGTAVSGLTFYLSSSADFKSYRVRLYGVK